MDGLINYSEKMIELSLLFIFILVSFDCSVKKFLSQISMALK